MLYKIQNCEPAKKKNTHTTTCINLNYFCLATGYEHSICIYKYFIYLHHHKQKTNLKLTFNKKLDLPITVHDRS